MTADVPPPSDDAGARIAAADAARLTAEHRADREHEARLRAEQRVAELEAQLAALHDQEERASISLFDDPQEYDERRRLPDGSDSAVLPIALAGTAIVAGLAALLALLNGRTAFALSMFVLAFLLGWWARATWVTPVEVTVADGVVHIDRGGSKHRFDLRNERIQVEVSGEPGDRHWEVRFLRRGLDPFVIRSDMVDPGPFLRQLREWRPDL